MDLRVAFSRSQQTPENSEIRNHPHCPMSSNCGQWAYSPAGIPTAAILTGWYAADKITTDAAKAAQQRSKVKKQG